MFKPYKFERFGREFVLLCTEEEAKRRGLKPVEDPVEDLVAKKATPANKARTAGNKK